MSGAVTGTERSDRNERDRQITIPHVCPGRTHRELPRGVVESFLRHRFAPEGSFRASSSSIRYIPERKSHTGRFEGRIPGICPPQGWTERRGFRFARKRRQRIRRSPERECPLLSGRKCELGAAQREAPAIPVGSRPAGRKGHPGPGLLQERKPLDQKRPGVEPVGTGLSGVETIGSALSFSETGSSGSREHSVVGFAGGSVRSPVAG